MATPIQEPLSLPSMPDCARVHADRATDQYMACLAIAGRTGPLQEYCRRLISSGDGIEAGYYLAFALASERKTEEALISLRNVLKTNKDHVYARRLAYRLLVNAARDKARAQDWRGVSDMVAEALLVAPQDADPLRDLESFKHALPIGYLRSGNRKDAAVLWEEQLKENPNDFRLLHNLALLYYWWARETSLQGPPSANGRWRAAIAYWAALVHSENFWNEWAEKRSQSWGFAFTPADLETVRTGVIEEKLSQYFQAHADQYAQKGDSPSVRIYEDHLTALALEMKSAATWKRAMSLLSPDRSRPHILLLPVGTIFAEQHHLLPHIAKAAEILGKGLHPAEVSALLRIYFSDQGLGTALILADDRNKPDDALALLDQLSKGVRESVPAQYVRALARARKGSIIMGHGKPAEALKEWRTAYDLILASRDDQFTALLAELRDSVCMQAGAAVKKEASRLKKEGKLDAAISMLESTRAMDKDGAILEILCVYLCDRGGELLTKKSYSSARDYLNKVLTLKNSYPRARQILSTVYNNEGCDEKNCDKSIALFEKAIEFGPDNYTAKQNFAVELKNKALQIFNPMPVQQLRYGCDEPIRLLERAAKLIGNELNPGALSAIESMAHLSAESAHQAIRKLDSDLLKAILSDLATIYNIRYKVRGY